MEKFEPMLELAGRILLAVVFIPAGFSKIGGYEATQGYMEAMGVPGSLLPLVIAFEIGGGLLFLVGYQTRIVAFALAGFCILSAVIFHYQPTDQLQMLMFMKNIGLAGGFLMYVAKGGGLLSIDAKLKRRIIAA